MTLVLYHMTVPGCFWMAGSALVASDWLSVHLLSYRDWWFLTELWESRIDCSERGTIETWPCHVTCLGAFGKMNFKRQNDHSSPLRAPHSLLWSSNLMQIIWLTALLPLEKKNSSKRGKEDSCQWNTAPFCHISFGSLVILPALLFQSFCFPFSLSVCSPFYLSVCISHTLPLSLSLALSLPLSLSPPSPLFYCWTIILVQTVKCIILYFIEEKTCRRSLCLDHNTACKKGKKRTKKELKA